MLAIEGRLLLFKICTAPKIQTLIFHKKKLRTLKKNPPITVDNLFVITQAQSSGDGAFRKAYSHVESYKGHKWSAKCTLIFLTEIFMVNFYSICVELISKGFFCAFVKRKILLENIGVLSTDYLKDLFDGNSRHLNLTFIKF